MNPTNYDSERCFCCGLYAFSSFTRDVKNGVRRRFCDEYCHDEFEKNGNKPREGAVFND